MPDCHICGETKETKDFICLPRFSKWKKKWWCRDCQKLFLDMKKQKEKEVILSTSKDVFTVSFQ